MYHPGREYQDSRVPFADGQYNGLFSGLRNLDAPAAECEGLTTTRDNKYVTRVQVGNEYSIDDEGLELFMEFEFERALSSERLNNTPSAAIHYLLGLGTVQLFKGSHSDWDRMLMVSNQLERHGLRPILHDPHAIIAHLKSKLPGIRGERTDPLANATAPVALEGQGSLFSIDDGASAEPAKQESVVQVQDEDGTDYAARYYTATEQMHLDHGESFQAPALGMLLGHCCELLSRQPRMQHTFPSFIELWISDSYGVITERAPEGSAYVPILKVAYSVLLANGMILAPQS